MASWRRRRQPRAGAVGRGWRSGGSSIVGRGKVANMAKAGSKVATRLPNTGMNGAKMAT